MNRGPILNQKRMLRFVLQGVALGGVATVVVFLFTSGRDTLHNLRLVSPALIPLLLVMVVTAWMCNGARVWLMCNAAGHKLRYRQAIAVSLSSEFGIAATPGGVGGAVIRLTLLRQAGVPLTTAGSLLAADATIDLIFFGFLAPFAVYELLKDGLLTKLLDKPTGLDALIAFLVLVVLVAAAVLLLRLEGFHRLVSRLAASTQFGRRKRLAARHRHLRFAFRRNLRRVTDAFLFLWQRRKAALFGNLLIASLQWCCRYMLLPVILLSIDRHSHVNPLPLFFVQGFLFALSLVVVVPGGGGSVELLSSLILPGLVPAGMVGVVVVLWRLFSYHLYVLAGGTMFFYVCHRLHRLFPNASQPMIEDAPTLVPGE